MFDRSAAVLAPSRWEQHEAAEKQGAAVVVVRIALARHDCPRLADGAALCRVEAHERDVAAAREVLEQLGVVEPRTTTRVCSRCRREKDLGQFAKNAKVSGGRETTCRMCRATDALRREAEKEAS
ncbi:hypothetical protein Pve01_66620 [Planomonospora venezuelensis]|nr:hypothetical protein Pve01_66620 [Planomonospora venezuelensis]